MRPVLSSSSFHRRIVRSDTPVSFSMASSSRPASSRSLTRKRWSSEYALPCAMAGGRGQQGRNSSGHVGLAREVMGREDELHAPFCPAVDNICHGRVDAKEQSVRDKSWPSLPRVPEIDHGTSRCSGRSRDLLYIHVPSSHLHLLTVNRGYIGSEYTILHTTSTLPLYPVTFIILL